MRLFVLLAFLLVAQVSFAQGIEFYEGPWKEALSKAKEEGKALFVDSYATWCGPCKRMAKQVFTQDKVGEYFNENFINLKLDMEKEDGVTFGHKYPVSAYPTLYFIGGEGNVIHKVKGGKSAEQLIDLGAMVLRKHDTSGEFAEKYEAGERSYDLVYSYIKALNKASKPSLKISNDYLRSNPEISEEQRLKFVHEAAVESDSKIFEEMLKHKKDVVKIVGEEAFAKKVKTATKSTVEKAIEYEVESLLDEAIESYKNALGNDKVEINHLQRHYYKNTGAKKKYIDMTHDLYKMVKDDPNELTKMYNQLKGNYKDPNCSELLEDIAERNMKLDDSPNNIIEYAKLMLNFDEFEKAEKAIDDKIKKYKDNPDDVPNNIQRFRQYLDKVKENEG